MGREVSTRGSNYCNAGAFRKRGADLYYWEKFWKSVVSGKKYVIEVFLYFFFEGDDVRQKFISWTSFFLYVVFLSLTVCYRFIAFFLFFSGFALLFERERSLCIMDEGLS